MFLHEGLETKPTVAITWNHARVFIYLFVYLFQQMKTTLKSTEHETYISFKQSFAIFSCIAMHLAILQKQLGVSLANLFCFLILWLHNVILQQFKKISNSLCSIHNVQGRQGLRYFSFFSMNERKLKAVWLHQLSS